MIVTATCFRRDAQKIHQRTRFCAETHTAKPQDAHTRTNSGMPIDCSVCSTKMLQRAHVSRARARRSKQKHPVDHYAPASTLLTKHTEPTTLNYTRTPTALRANHCKTSNNYKNYKTTSANWLNDRCKNNFVCPHKNFCSRVRAPVRALAAMFYVVL